MAWRPSFAVHRLLPYRVRVEICTALALAGDDHRTRSPRYPEAHICRLPLELMCQIFEFVSSRLVRNYLVPRAPRVLIDVTEPRSVAVTSEGHILLTHESGICLVTSEGEILHSELQRDLWGVTALPGGGGVVCADDTVLFYNETLELVRVVGQKGDLLGEFDCPEAVAVDRSGNIVVADTRNDRIQVLAPDGTPLRMFGTTGGGEGELICPCELAVIGDSIFVADAGNHRVQEFRSDGTFVREVVATDGRLEAWALAVDGAENLVLADGDNNCVVALRPDGEVIWRRGTTGAGLGEFSLILGVAVMDDGAIVVVDNGNHRVQFV